METGLDLTVDFRLLLLDGCLVLEGEEEERFDADGFLILQRDRDQWMRGGLDDKDVQIRYAVRVLLEKKTDNFNILQVSLETLSLTRSPRQFALWTARVMEHILLPIVGVGGV